MRIGVTVDPKLVLAAGGKECGRKIIDLNPAEWTEEERQTLAAYSDSHNDYTRYFPGADLVMGLSGLVAPTVEELRRVVGRKIEEKKKAEQEQQQRAAAEKERLERERVERLAADPYGDKWLSFSGWTRKGCRQSWVVKYCPWSDPETAAVATVAQAEADRRNAELDAKEDAEAAKDAERKRLQELKKVEATAKLETWVRASGSELARLRLDHGYDCWVSAALGDYADAVANGIAAGLELAGDMDGYTPEADERKCPTLTELQILTAAEKQAKEYTAGDGTTAAVELIRVTYTPEDDSGNDETVKRTELRVTVTVCGWWEIERDYVIDGE